MEKIPLRNRTTAQSKHTNRKYFDINFLTRNIEVDACVSVFCLMWKKIKANTEHYFLRLPFCYVLLDAFTFSTQTMHFILNILYLAQHINSIYYCGQVKFAVCTKNAANNSSHDISFQSYHSVMIQIPWQRPLIVDNNTKSPFLWNVPIKPVNWRQIRHIPCDNIGSRHHRKYSANEHCCFTKILPISPTTNHSHWFIGLVGRINDNVVHGTLNRSTNLPW